MKFLVLLLILTGFAAAQANSGEWLVRRVEWTDEDERNFSEFVQALGRSKCNTVDQCIRSEANIYRDSDPEDVRFYSDCADFPYFLRAYFAWKNELPFGYVSQVRSFDADEQKKNPPALLPGEVAKPIDNRYSLLGNYATGRRTLVPPRDGFMNFFDENKRLQNIISSAMFRLSPDLEGKVASDFYSPKLKAGSIRAGTVIYDPNGHVAVVYDVLPDGRVLYFDAHPDNSVTRGIYSAKFARSKPAQGAGFKNFRPLRLAGAQLDDWGESYIGGQLVYDKNSEIPDFSTMQYYGAQPNTQDWKLGTFQLNGRNLVFHEYVRASLATEKINPVSEFMFALQELCEDFNERIESVQAAVNKQIHLQSHPENLPRNLFGSEGDWENYSTPGRDTRLRATFLELKKNLEDRYQDWLKNDFSDMKYEGSDLKRDLLRAFHRTNLECAVNYTNSAGRKVSLGFELAIKRLFKLSFDPYHCPERRWGATHAEELKTCADEAGKVRWYNAEQSVRNDLRRDWSSPLPITVDDLEAGRFGQATAPEIDLRKFLESLPNKGSR